MRLFAAYLLAAQCLAQAPEYSLAGLVDAAGNVPGRLAPNSRATLYGRNLNVPDAPGALRVRVGAFTATITYASANQVNFIVPHGLHPAVSQTLVVVRGGVTGPPLQVILQREAPELYVLPNSAYALAARPDGVLVSPDAPAAPGSIVVLYGNGLGPTRGESGGLAPAVVADPIVGRLDIWLDGRQLPPEHLLYAGVAPGFIALYQINLRLPEDVGPNPLIQLGFRGESSSHPGVRLAVGSSGNAPAP